MKVLDLFSGIGGFSLGLERAGMETVAFCEFDSHAQRILNKHWPGVPIHNDVRALDGKQYRGTVDVVCGGFPCQPHSTAGQRKASSDERDMWKDTARIVREVQPKYCIFENVRGLLSSEQGFYFAEIAFDLAESGYSVELYTIAARSVGANHLRKRIWIVANSNIDRLQGSHQEQGKTNRTDGSSTRGEIGRAFIKEQIERASRSNFWIRAEPLVRRADDGFPGRVDRLKRLGNAVVPKIPEIIGRAIMDYEFHKTQHHPPAR